MGRLTDKVAVVTGAGAGIGLATASLFAAEGAHVYVTDIDGDSATAATAALNAKGFAATALTVDVSRGQDVTALMRQVSSAHGRIDVLVNNAGIATPKRGDLLDVTEDAWDLVLNANLKGPFFLSQLVATRMIDLKAREFTPEAAGKMNCYLSSVDEQFRQSGDQPSIGLILCRS